jgi:hypothetical protein
MASTFGMFESYGFLPEETPKPLALQFLQTANSASNPHCGCLSDYPRNYPGILDRMRRTEG